MWKVSGTRFGREMFEPFEPVETLCDVDGPRPFTFRDRMGQLCLAHWCDEESGTTRFIVVPFSNSLVHRLRAGELTLRDALDQPRIWIVDALFSGELHDAWAVQLTDLPSDALPYPGTMLLPALEPLISLRALGEGIQEGLLP